MSESEWFSRLVDLMARLRGPDGCPWDREQTLTSLRPYILEEAYELVDAIDRAMTNDGDNPRASEGVKEELGDLLLEVVFVAQIAREQGAFEPSEFIENIHAKIVRRHPHVFGAEDSGTADEALRSWEAVKDAERKTAQDGSDSVLDGVALSLPALVRANKLSSRAARAGFDWDEAKAVRDKVDEEISELDEAIRDGDRNRIADEIGDCLFALVNLARHLDLDPEQALRGTNRKFASRFRSMEGALRSADQTMKDASAKYLDELWRAAKRSEAVKTSKEPS